MSDITAHFSEISQHAFTCLVNSSDQLDENQLSRWKIPDLDCYQLVFINGLFSEKFSMVDDLTFDIHDGFILDLKKNQTLIKPIHVLHTTTQNNLMTNTCNRIHLQEGAHATVIESFVGLDDITYFSKVTTDIHLSERLQLSHYKMQQQGKNAFHVDSLSVQQAYGSCLQAYSFSTGSKLARSDTRIHCMDERVTSKLYGLYFGRNKQQLDHHIVVHHARGNCQSSQHYKGVVSDHAQIGFDGKIIVDENAQKTNARQINKNLLLSDSAVAVSKPQLTIFADDVKCAHGATVGHLDEQALFYLQSRGISSIEAKRLLVSGFAGDIIEKINLGSVKKKCQQFMEEIA